MLIYNHKKEFFGIDENDLHVFGFSNLSDFYNEVSDFADLFVKTPGYIHNFQHVHWIDYITCDDSGMKPKVIINVKGKSFTTTINIRAIYLSDNPSQNGYIVELRDIEHSTTHTTQIDKTIITKTPAQKTVIEQPKEPKQEPRQEEKRVVKQEVEHKDEYGDLSIKPIHKESIEPKKEPLIEIKKIVTNEEKDSFSNYIYDPHVASQELGLPLDLIEEFIEDFIAQAYNFKSGFYESLNTRNLNNLKAQSHKLKGVAANLRIEDALDVLTLINTSDNYEEIKINLERLYKIIDKLSNKNSVETEQNIPKESKKLPDEDDFTLSIKDHDADIKDDKKITPLEIKDSEVPDSIDILELEDDEFLKPKVVIKETELSDEDLSIFENVLDKNETISKSVKDEASDISFFYDKKVVAEDIGLDIESFELLFEEYIKDSKEQAEKIIKLINENDLSTCKNLAIKIRGMSENMRIHILDNDLESIINAQDTIGLNNIGETIISKLNILSNIENN